LIAGRSPAGPDDVVVSQQVAGQAGVKAGGLLTVAVQGTALTLRVAGVAAPGDSQQPAVFFTDARAQALLGRPGQVDTIAVYPDAGTAVDTVAKRVTAALPAGSAMVLTGGARGRAEFPEAAAQRSDLIPLAGAVGGL